LVKCHLRSKKLLERDNKRMQSEMEKMRSEYQKLLKNQDEDDAMMASASAEATAGGEPAAEPPAANSRCVAELNRSDQDIPITKHTFII
jgi:hypothetical protein